MLTIIAGLVAGGVHVMAGPDHLAALVPIALRDPTMAARVGAAWGVGHGGGVVVLGGLGILLRGSLDVDALSAWSELAVGALLIAIGLWALRQTRALTIHAHQHAHPSTKESVEPVRSHFHVHINDVPHDHPRAHERHTHAALGVGLLHGMAGTGHLLGVLPSLALPPQHAATYLAAYLTAAILSMAGVGLALGAVARSGTPLLMRRLMAVSGVSATGLGAVWVVQSWPGS